MRVNPLVLRPLWSGPETAVVSRRDRCGPFDLQKLVVVRLLSPPRLRPDGLDLLEGDIDPLLPVGVAGRMPRLDRLVVSPEGVSPSREASAMRGAIAAASVSSTLTSMFVVFVAIFMLLSSS